MKKLYFSIFISASREKVWETMLSDSSYREWTKSFNPGGSYYKGDWSQGSKILFLGPNPDGSGEGGMVSRIKENRLYEYISIEHLGIIKNGVEDTTSEEVKKWTPAFENYIFREKDGGTEIVVDIDSNEEYAKMFSEMWTKALQSLKELCEK
ncbi:MAG: SRPBCC domain-containing protein [Candidatus Magasanikbacteria bacterium]